MTSPTQFSPFTEIFCDPFKMPFACGGDLLSVTSVLWSKSTAASSIQSMPVPRMHYPKNLKWRRDFVCTPSLSTPSFAKSLKAKTLRRQYTARRDLVPHPRIHQVPMDPYPALAKPLKPAPRRRKGRKQILIRIPSVRKGHRHLSKLHAAMSAR